MNDGEGGFPDIRLLPNDLLSPDGSLLKEP